MSLTQEQIKNISENLSKIHSGNNDLTNDLNNILKYFDLLNEVNTKNVKATYSVIEKDKNQLRKDVEEVNKESSSKELLECSNQKVIANQIAVTNIMSN